MGIRAKAPTKQGSHNLKNYLFMLVTHSEVFCHVIIVEISVQTLKHVYDVGGTKTVIWVVCTL